MTIFARIKSRTTVNNLWTNEKTPMIRRLKNSHDTEENMTQNKRTRSMEIKHASNKHCDITLKTIFLKNKHYKRL